MTRCFKCGALNTFEVFDDTDNVTILQCYRCGSHFKLMTSITQKMVEINPRDFSSGNSEQKW